MRDVHAATEGWAALVALMNMPEKKQDLVLKKMETLNSSAIHGDLCISTMSMCDEVSYDEEAKNFRNEGMRKMKEASIQSRTPLQKPKESVMFSNTGDQRATRPSNLGCYCSGEFRHVKRE